MRHNKKFNHLGRKTAHRGAMLSNMATSLIMHKRIFTTVPKAKALRVYVEPLINRSKEDTTNSRRVVFSALQNKEAVTELFQGVSQKVADRPGGYTRIIKTGYRLGDNAAMCFIELVDYNENMLKEESTKKAKTRRSRRKASDSTTVADSSKKVSEGKAEKSTKTSKTEKTVKAEKAAAPEKVENVATVEDTIVEVAPEKEVKENTEEASSDGEEIKA